MSCFLQKRWLLLTPIILVVGLFVLDKLVFFAGRAILSESSYRYIQFYSVAPQSPVDILILGNSRAEQHFPRHYYENIRILNWGMGWVGVPISSAMALDYIELNGTPKALLIDTTFFDYSGTGRAHGAIQSVFSDRVENIIQSDSKYSNNIARRVFHTLKFNENNFVPAVAKIIKRGAVNYSAGSRIISPGRIKKALPASKNINLKFQNYDVIKSVINTYRNLRIPVALVTTPLHPAGLLSYTEFDAFVDDIDKLAEETLVPHLNLSRWNISNELYADTTHLNKQGARQFVDDFFSCFMHYLDENAASWDYAKCSAQFDALNHGMYLRWIRQSKNVSLTNSYVSYTFPAHKSRSLGHAISKISA